MTAYFLFTLACSILYELLYIFIDVTLSIYITVRQGTPGCPVLLPPFKSYSLPKYTGLYSVKLGFSESVDGYKKNPVIASAAEEDVNDSYSCVHSREETAIGSPVN